MYSIRNLRVSDKEDVRRICIETASASATDTPLKRAVLCDLYCDYYVEYATDTSFVAADGDDRAIGYVFCAPDYREYEKNYRKYILPVLRKHKFSRALTKNLELVFERKLARGMPAHLHIDILQEAQRQGIGHRLMNALMFRLKELGVPKVYLVVGTRKIRLRRGKGASGLPSVRDRRRREMRRTYRTRNRLGSRRRELKSFIIACL